MINARETDIKSFRDWLHHPETRYFSSKIQEEVDTYDEVTHKALAQGDYKEADRNSARMVQILDILDMLSLKGDENPIIVELRERKDKNEG
jgi:hypothetical protein